MKRKLLRQMGAEWRANIWMALELLIVSVVLFVLADKIYTAVVTVNEPLGFDSGHCYVLDTRQLSEAAPDYTEKSEKESVDDLITLMERLRARPEIEAASLAAVSHPYNWSNSWEQVTVDTFKTASHTILKRYVDKDYFKVFRLRGANGETPEQLGELLEKYKVLVTDNILRDGGIESVNSIRKNGSKLYVGNDTLELGPAIAPMKYSENRSKFSSTTESFFRFLRPRSYMMAGELTVRVKDNMDKDFIENLMKDADGNLKVGNFYIASVRSFDTIRENFNRSDDKDRRNTIICALFLLVNIFLGIFGTFWFRTRQRASEIALREVCGATRRDIFVRILGEGQLLLLLVTLPAVAIDYVLTQYELTTWYDGFFEPVRFIISALIAWGLMSLMIVAGISFPALKAMKTPPAESLKNE